jgi:dipeptidyl-peptidase 4
MSPFLRIVMMTCLFSCFLSLSLFAQGSLHDYQRANSLDDRTQNTVFRDTVRPQWSEDGNTFWYRVQIGRDQHEFVFVDAAQGLRRAAFDHPRLASALAGAVTQTVIPTQLPFQHISLTQSGVRFTAFSQNWEWNDETGKLTKIEEAIEPGNQLTAYNHPFPSRYTGEQSQIRFVNKTNRKIELFWMDTQGKRRSYGIIGPGASREQHSYAGHVWLIADQEGNTLGVFECQEKPAEAVIEINMKTVPRNTQRRDRSRADHRSPDEAWRVSVLEHNVVLEQVESEETRQLTTNGTEEDGYTSQIHWAPNSKSFVVMREKKGEERTVYLIESSPEDQLQPKLHSFSYNKPGDQLARIHPCLFSLEGEIAVNRELMMNPWSISRLHWKPDSHGFYFIYNQRGHQVLRVIYVDAQTGEAQAVIDEQSQTFIDYAGKQYLNYLDNTNEILWMSERDGWNHLYLINAATGKVKQQLTHGNWVVRNVEHVDTQNRQLWFSAGGIVPNQDPYYLHLCRVNLDGSHLEVLTNGNGTHTWEFSPDRRYFIDTWSRVDMPPVNELRCSQTGVLLCRLETADWSALLETGWMPPEPFTTKGRDGVTDIYGIIIRPSNFQSGKQYPVVEEIYAGPHGSFVPKSFNRYLRRTGMAELGFIVVQIDGMGTSHRSKRFHDVCWKNLGDAGFPDRIAWMKAARKQFPEMDLTRVGIYGGSAGGQNALRALLAHGDFYSVAVADCGCHDNRMDKVWWNELWMGWPIGPHYEEQSNVTQSHNLQGKLLLIVGELDRNVDPASTLQVVDALVKANKDFDLLILPGTGHGAAESPYGQRRRKDFLVRHLLQVEPRWIQP